MIYFIRMIDAGAIKIGTTVNFPSRLGNHAKMGRISILGVHDGSFEEEKAVHRMFSHLRLKASGHGRRPELFRPDPELLDYIAKNCRDPDLFDQLHEKREKLRPIRLALPREVHRQLRMEAAIEGTSMAALAQKIILEALDRWRAEPKSKSSVA